MNLVTVLIFFAPFFFSQKKVGPLGPTFFGGSHFFDGGSHLFGGGRSHLFLQRVERMSASTEV